MAGDLWQDLRHGVRGPAETRLVVYCCCGYTDAGYWCQYWSLSPALTRNSCGPGWTKTSIPLYESMPAYTRDPARPGEPGRSTLENYVAFRDQAKSLRNLAAYCQFDTLLGHDDPVEVRPHVHP
jgi:hypothetical protein